MVYLVGAGPGDPELLTLKGKRVLERADAILYDELANPELLHLAPAAAERLYVGKRAGHHALSQAEIQAWMIERARRGLNVVRLKGGDPLVFGRGGEEIAALARAGVDWEIVPGVSAGTGVPAAAAIPLTHRGLASSVRFLAGHTALAAPRPADGPALGTPGETLVIFMGLHHLAETSAQLLARGWPASTPVAVIERGTLPGERLIHATLKTIGAKARRLGAQTPALVIVGAVAALPRKWMRLHQAAAASGLTAKTTRAPDGRRAPGLILMAHGSPLKAWQLGVDRLARELALPGQFSRAAYLPPVLPGLAEAVKDAVGHGVDRLAVVPYFLAPGLHVSRDLPKLVEAERRRYPRLQIELTDCLEGHPALRTAVLARAGAAWAQMSDRRDRGDSRAGRAGVKGRNLPAGRT